MAHYVFILFFISSFFIVYLWSSVSKFSSIFFWNGTKFALRQDFLNNYNVFSQSGEIYECGFSGVEEPLNNIELQYLVLAIFFIIYEIELLLFLPFFLNLEFGGPLAYAVVAFSFLLILVSYWYEWDYYLLHFTYSLFYSSLYFNAISAGPSAT